VVYVVGHSVARLSDEVFICATSALLAFMSVLLGRALKLDYSAKLFGMTFILVVMAANEAKGKPRRIHRQIPMHDGSAGRGSCYGGQGRSCVWPPHRAAMSYCGYSHRQGSCRGGAGQVLCVGAK
jgi:hypothetical protein